MLKQVQQTEQSDATLDVKNLRVWYGAEKGPVRAVDDVSFTLQPGKVLGLVGESGCGKSTLGRSLLGLLPEGSATAGNADFNGKNLLKLDKGSRRGLLGQELAMIFQEPMTRLNPLMKVGDHFKELLRAHVKGISGAEAHRRTLEALRQVGIPATRVNQYPHQFSGGMRQRIMIALAIVLRPSLVIADEPTTALDVIVEGQILSLLRRIKEQVGMSVILVTHNLGIVVDNCDDIAVMYAGRIAEYGPSADVFNDPRHPYTQGLLRSVITAETKALESIPGSPPDLSKSIRGCLFCPRCPRAMDVCAKRSPPEISIGKERRVACWLEAPDLTAADRQPIERRELEDAV